MTQLRILQRVIQGILGVTAVLMVLAVVALGAGAYLTASGHSLVLLKATTTGLGKLFAGQRTEQLNLEVAVFPERRYLEGHARLNVRSLHDQKKRFYFLLNDGLTVRRARVLGSSAPVAFYQLWLAVVVDIGREVGAGEVIDLELQYEGNPARGSFGDGAILDTRDVLLEAGHFWYPTDLQGFFQTDVVVRLPERLTLVHNGRELERAERGDRKRVRWRSERPIAGMALVAGMYQRTTMTADNLPLQLYLAADVDLDAQRVLRDMAHGNSILARRFGPSGFHQLTAFVTRRLRRAFNDGAGVMGISIRYFRRGEYGFNVITHEIAHNWWGGLVAEKWLAPGTGGEWIVEGLAEFSSLLAAEERWGRDALIRRLQQEFFDPARQSSLAEMSVLDNLIDEANARDTIYRKGAYVAMMLRNAIGDEAMQEALRQVIERHRYTQISERDLEAVVSETSGQDVSTFFADWVRSDNTADLVVEPSGADQVDLHNRGTAVVPGEVALWFFQGGKTLAQRSAKVGETVPLPAGVEFTLLDPQLDWADVVRGNNRWPRQPQPRFVAANSRGDLLITIGEPHRWAPTTLLHLTADGKRVHRWDFERGFVEPPAWSADGGRILVSTSSEEGDWPTIISLNAIDGTKTTIGHAAHASLGANGRIFATRGDRLVRFDPNGSGAFRTVARHRGRAVESPVSSPSGKSIVYVVGEGNASDLRVCNEDGEQSRSLLTWDRDHMLIRWAHDESRLYAVVGGDWDWQIWEIPLDHSSVRVLAREAAAIRGLAVSPAGNQLAFVAAPSVAGPLLAHHLYVLDVASGRPTVPDLGGGDVWHIAWESSNSLMVVMSTGDVPVAIPEPRAVRRVRLTEATSEPVEIVR